MLYNEAMKFVTLIIITILFVLLAMALILFQINKIDSTKHSDQDLKTNIKQKTPKIEFSAWMPWWDTEAGMQIFEEHSSELVEISPYWFVLSSNQQFLETTTVEKQAFYDKTKTLNTDIKILPMISTELYGESFNGFVKDNTKLTLFTKTLVESLLNYRVQGLDLDFENLDSSNKEAFSKLVILLSEELHKNNLELSVTISGRTLAEDKAHAYDLALIGKHADQVRLMIYDKHGEFTEPGAISPNTWFEEVLEYKLSQLPKEKVVVGLPTYGYFWGYDKSFKSLTFNQVSNYSDVRNFNVIRDGDSGELVYSDSNEIGWVSDSQSIKRKIEISKRWGLYRFIFWSINGMDPEIFSAY